MICTFNPICTMILGETIQLNCSNINTITLFKNQESAGEPFYKSVALSTHHNKRLVQQEIIMHPATQESLVRQGRTGSLWLLEKQFCGCLVALLEVSDAHACVFDLTVSICGFSISLYTQMPLPTLTPTCQGHDPADTS